MTRINIMVAKVNKIKDTESLISAYINVSNRGVSDESIVLVIDQATADRLGIIEEQKEIKRGKA